MAVRKPVVAALVALALLPGPALVAVAVIASPAAAACAAGQGLAVKGIPETLTVTTSDGAEVVLDRSQLGHAATIIAVGARTPGVTRDAIVIALMAALTESRLLNYADPAYPETLTLPHDAVGTDHDSTGLFQMRHATGWGSVADLMDTTYQARAFYGGPTGPNHGSPPGLLDVPGWQGLTKGEAAQAVERSAYPDRYEVWQGAAQAILAALTTPTADAGGDAIVAETGAVFFPLPAGSWVKTSDFGWRTHPVFGDRSFHSGTDYAAIDGTPILAVADGVVVRSGPAAGFGNVIVINHNVGGESVSSVYGHMWDGHLYVAAGDAVVAGQHIGDVGSAGLSSGPHLHLEIHPGTWPGNPTDPHAWLAANDAAEPSEPLATQTGCYL